MNHDGPFWVFPASPRGSGTVVSSLNVPFCVLQNVQAKVSAVTSRGPAPVFVNRVRRASCHALRFTCRLSWLPWCPASQGHGALSDLGGCKGFCARPLAARAGLPPSVGARAGDSFMPDVLFLRRILSLGWVPQERDDGTIGGGVSPHTVTSSLRPHPAGQRSWV